MSVIQTPPKGFQDVLGLKNFGRNPSELIDQVTPTIDIGQFYQANKLDIARTDITNPTAGGTPAELIIPTGENWFVAYVHTYMDNLLTTSQDVVVRNYIDLPRENATGIPDAFFLKPAVLEQATYPNTDQLWESQPVGLWFPSGTTIAAQVALLPNPAAATVLSIGALILRVDV